MIALLSTVFLVAITPAGSLAYATQDTWILEEDLRIGSVNDSSYALTRIRDLEVADEGAIYVLQHLERSVKVFDSSGHLVRVIGRDGEGPGEFRSPHRMSWSGDIIGISDVRLGRLTMYTLDGRVQRTISYMKPYGVLWPLTPRALLQDGNTLAVGSVSVRLVADGTVKAVPILRLTADGTILNTVAMWDRTNSSTAIDVDPQRGSLFVGQPFSDAPLMDVDSRNGTVVFVDRRVRDSSSAFFRVTIVRMTGDTLSSRTYRYDPKPLTRRIVNARVNIIMEGLSRRPAWAAPVTERLLRRALFIPLTLPSVTAVVAGRDGTTWLRRESPVDPGPVVWTVLSSTGEILADAYAPQELTVFQSNTEFVWGVVRDELDIPYVVRYRVKVDK